MHPPALNLLAFDTSTETLSIAVRHGMQVYAHSGSAGAAASTTLIPRIFATLAQAKMPLNALDAVVFGRGPGAFTGLRTACAVAQGLAFGARARGADAQAACSAAAQLPVLPVDTLLAVAEQARAEHGCQRVVAVLDARMGEVYCAAFEWLAQDACWQVPTDFCLCPPESVQVPFGWTVAGNAQRAYGTRLAPRAHHVHALPTAAALLRLAPTLLASGAAVPATAALPRYIRDKVAYTTAERQTAQHNQ